MRSSASGGREGEGGREGGRGWVICAFRRYLKRMGKGIIFPFYGVSIGVIEKVAFSGLGDHHLHLCVHLLE